MRDYNFREAIDDGQEVKTLERLQKIMARAGVASRRKCEELILTGQVEVNGQVVRTLGAKADPAVDEIKVAGRVIKAENKLYFAFNKPKGVITSASDPQGRKVVADFFRDVKERVYPVGRLDYDTEGLLIVTNDGDFANRLTHPSGHIPRTYHAVVKGVPHGTQLEKLAKGIRLDDGMTAPAEVEYRDVDPDKNEATIEITLYEGRNRQVRRMFEAIGHPVKRLKRVRFGSLTLQGIPRGKYRPLTPEEVRALLEEAERSHKVHK